MKTMTYKGFTGTVEWSDDDQCYFGKLQNIDDLVMYEGSTREELEDYFREAVDYHIQEERSITQ